MSISLEEGSIVEGKVTKIKPFGALVELPGNIQGLVHISHISTAYVQNVSEYLTIGDIVKVKILSIDTKTNKISLSIKDASDQQKREPERRSFENRSEHYGDVRSFDDRNRGVVGDASSTFEDKFKEFVKVSNERLAGLNKRNKKR